MDSSSMENDRIGKYHIIGRLREGANGVVLKALNTETNEIVALKWLEVPENYPTSSVREISILSELEHPNIVRFKDVERSSSTELYLVLECLDTDLKKYMKQNPELFENPDLVKVSELLLILERLLSASS